MPFAVSIWIAHRTKNPFLTLLFLALAWWVARHCSNFLTPPSKKPMKNLLSKVWAMTDVHFFLYGEIKLWFACESGTMCAYVVLVGFVKSASLFHIAVANPKQPRSSSFGWIQPCVTIVFLWRKRKVGGRGKGKGRGRERRKGKGNWKWSFGRNGKNHKCPSWEPNPRPQKVRLMLYHLATETSNFTSQFVWNFIRSASTSQHRHHPMPTSNVARGTSHGRHCASRTDWKNS